jgi:hypothetical protein
MKFRYEYKRGGTVYRKLDTVDVYQYEGETIGWGHRYKAYGDLQIDQDELVIDIPEQAEFLMILRLKARVLGE